MNDRSHHALEPHEVAGWPASGDPERERRRLELILDSISEAITAVFVDTGVTVRNRAWLTFHGYASFADLSGWRFEEVVRHFEIYDEEGRALPASEAPMSRALRGEAFEDLQVRLRRRDTGREWWGSYSGSALRDADGKVVAAMITMRDVTRQRRAEAALRESEERFRRAVTNAAVPIMLHAEDGEILAVSQGLLRATGYTRAELGRFDDWLRLAYRRRAPERAERIAWRFREDLPIDGAEVPVHTRDGAVRRWVWNAPPPERLADGRKCMFAIASDITERKAAEGELRSLVEQRDRLLLELNHRVKNNLQLVMSLLKIQAARSGEPKVMELFDQAGKRIAAIAQVHGSLYRSEAAGSLDIAAYLRALCQPLADSFLETSSGRVGLELEAEPAQLEADRAIPLGLIVNELVTNAFKHGLAAGRVPGTVRVRFEAAGTGHWRLEVANDGRQQPAAPTPDGTGLGMQLVEGFTRQLRGSLQIERGPVYRVRIEFPR